MKIIFCQFFSIAFQHLSLKSHILIHFSPVISHNGKNGFPLLSYTDSRRFSLLDLVAAELPLNLQMKIKTKSQERNSQGFAEVEQNNLAQLSPPHSFKAHAMKSQECAAISPAFDHSANLNADL